MNFSFRDLLREATQPATLRAIPFILFGCFVAAVALVYFINPYGIVPGGAFGASIVIHAIFPSMPIGTLGLMIQIPLMLISMLVLGGRLGVRTDRGGHISSAFCQSAHRIELSGGRGDAHT